MKVKQFVYKMIAEQIVHGLKEVDEEPFGAPKTPSSTPSQPSSGTPPIGETETPEQEVLSFAQEMTTHTRDVPSILRGINGIIQNKYPNLRDAQKLVGMLQATQNETLKTVAFQLDRYLKAV